MLFIRRGSVEPNERDGGQSHPRRIVEAQPRSKGVAIRAAAAPAEEAAAPEPQEAEFVSLEDADAEAQGAKGPVETERGGSFDKRNFITDQLIPRTTLATRRC
jgi:hypothetical protein